MKIIKNFPTKVRYFLFFCLLLFPTIINAQRDRTYTNITVLDKLSNKPLSFVKVNAYDMADTSQVDFLKLGGCAYAMGDISLILYTGRKYKLELTACNMTVNEDGTAEIDEDETYEKLWVDADLSNVTEDNFVNPVQLPPAFFEKKRKEQLKEITVTASRIMFYHKGDTLVYRADAFVLAEGSMLDALFEQLPGVEMRGNGEIYCRGKKVDNLLINGKDLFNGNKQLMLENLGAYTVKNIAVYDKSGYISDLMGEKVGGDSEHVMDVILKKHYKTGFMINAEGGYGTHDRYLGKLFGMWYNDFASVSAYANLNNLSDSRKPGKDNKAWDNQQTGKGVETRQNAGIVYTTSNRANTWELKGDVDFSHTDNDLQETMSNQTFMFPTDMFNYHWQTKRNKNIQLSTDHKFRTKQIPRTSLYVNPTFSYNKFDNDLSQLSATFNRDMSEEISKDLVSDIYESNSNNVLKNLINRNRLNELNTGHNMTGSLDLRAHTRISDHNMLAIYMLGDYHKIHSDLFRRDDVKYGNLNLIQQSTNYQYFKSHPNKTVNITPGIEFTKFLPDFYNCNIPIYYSYTHYENVSTSELYNLDQLQMVPEFGVLPSMSQYVQTFDPDNSYRANTRDDSHNISIKFTNNKMFKGFGNYYYTIYLDMSVIFSDRNYNYIIGDSFIDIKRRNILYNYSANILFTNIKNSNVNISLSSTPTKASLAEMVDRPRTDPLNIYLGNRSLKDSYTHKISLSYGTTRGQTTHSVSAGASLLQNAQARSYVMDPATGVRTFSTHNVQGNWSANAGYNYFTAFGQYRNLDISSNTRGTFVRNVDLVGGMRRRRVSTVTVGEEVKFNWKLGSHRLSAFADANWHRYLGKDEGFAEFSAWNMKYGVSGVLNLPYNWGLSTDMVMYTRRGYADPNLNTTDVVWNARVSKSLLKGSVVLALDAYDLLHQISTVSYMVNAQARTETVVNSIPSYLLFHIYYRFNKQPKKK